MAGDPDFGKWALGTLTTIALALGTYALIAIDGLSDDQALHQQEWELSETDERLKILEGLARASAGDPLDLLSLIEDLIGPCGDDDDDDDNGRLKSLRRDCAELREDFRSRPVILRAKDR